jgi:hypothetical protein
MIEGLVWNAVCRGLERSLLALLLSVPLGLLGSWAGCGRPAAHQLLRRFWSGPMYAFRFEGQHSLYLPLVMREA